MRAKAPSVDRTIFKRRRSRYTSISNTPLRDENLPLDAVGFLACIMSLPEDWQFNRAWAFVRFSIGKEKLERIIADLTKADYVRREKQECGADGRFGLAVYMFTDEPGDFGEATVGGLAVSGSPVTVGGLAANRSAVDGKQDATKDLSSFSTKDAFLQKGDISDSKKGRPALGAVPVAELSQEQRAEMARLLKQTARRLKA